MKNNPASIARPDLARGARVALAWFALAASLAACDAYRGAPDAAKYDPPFFPFHPGCCIDPYLPACGGSLAGMIEDARVTVIPDCGHMMMVERPDATLDAIKEVA